MNENPPAPESEQSEEESLKKTTRISLEEALNVKPSSPKKTTSIMSDQFADKNVTGPIAGIPTHTGPIPQTIRLKRPSTSPIVINPPDITSAPTVVKTAHAKVPAAPSGDTATVIIIAHGSGFATLYAHLNDERPPIVRVGERVTAGQTIAYTGSTGWSTGPHVHFMTIVSGRAVDPRQYLP